MHTPGPWHVNAGAFQPALHCIEAAGPEGPRDVTVAVVHGTAEDRGANARLIAAAPDLLAALRLYFRYPVSVVEFVRAASAAIAKAEGRSE